MRLELNKAKPDTSEERKLMTFKEIPSVKKKVQYLFDYYSKPFLICAVIIAIIISAGVSIYNNLKYQEVFYCTIINNGLSEEDTASLEAEFADYYAIDKAKEKVVFDSSLRINYSEDSIDTEASYVSFQKLAAMVAAQQIDCMITDDIVMSSWAQNGSFLNLNEALPPEVFSQISEHLVSYTVYENEQDTTGVNGLYAIDLSESQWAQKNGIYLERPLFSIIANTKRPEAAIEFIKYAFGI